MQTIESARSDKNDGTIEDIIIHKYKHTIRNVENIAEQHTEESSEEERKYFSSLIPTSLSSVIFRAGPHTNAISENNGRDR